MLPTEAKGTRSLELQARFDCPLTWVLGSESLLRAHNHCVIPPVPVVDFVLFLRFILLCLYVHVFACVCVYTGVLHTHRRAGACGEERVVPLELSYESLQVGAGNKISKTKKAGCSRESRSSSELFVFLCRAMGGTRGLTPGCSTIGRHPWA